MDQDIGGVRAPLNEDMGEESTMIMDKVLSSRILRGVEGGASEVALRLPWYRALPLSVVEIVSLSIDGEAIARDRQSLVVDGEAYAIDDLKNHTEAVWFMRDDAFLRVAGFTAEPGREYQVAVSVSWNPPYAKGWWPVTACAEAIKAA